MHPELRARIAKWVKGMNSKASLPGLESWPHSLLTVRPGLIFFCGKPSVSVLKSLQASLQQIGNALPWENKKNFERFLVPRLHSSGSLICNRGSCHLGLSTAGSDWERTDFQGSPVSLFHLLLYFHLPSSLANKQLF